MSENTPGIPESSTQIGVDQWVERADENIERPTRPRGPDRAPLGAPPAGREARVPDPGDPGAVPPLRQRGEPLQLRPLHPDLRPARARPERRGRLRRPARPRLRRVLRLRRLHLRLPLRDALEQGPRLHAPLGRPVVDPRRGAHLRPARPVPRVVLPPPARRLPRDRDALLRPGLRRLHERRRPVRDHQRLERPGERRPARRSSASRSTRRAATTGSCSAASSSC